MTRTIRFLTCIASAFFVFSTTGSYAALIVDFADSSANVPATAAPFVFVNGTAGPITRNYASGSQGYTGGSFDTGAGVTAVLRSFRSTDGALNTSSIRMIDRSDSTADLLNDWTTIEPGVGNGAVPIIGLQLSITGLATGIYDFSSLHDDTAAGPQTGVMDVQYSLNGGTNWINLADNLSYSTGATVSVTEVPVDTAFGFSIRYLAGGGLYGGNGQTTNTTANNRLLPLNSFQVTAIPEPGCAALLFGGLCGGLLFYRRRAV